MFFLFVQAGMQAVEETSDTLKKQQEEIKKKITGEEEPAVPAIRKIATSSAKNPRKYQYTSAKIHISQGGCPPSNDTTANMREIVKESEQQTNRPLIVSCRHSHDVFESKSHDRIRDPAQDQVG